MKRFFIIIPLFLLIKFSTNVYAEIGCISGDCHSGEGVYVFSDKSGQYRGSFKDGKFHGKGILFINGADKGVSGFWQNGKKMPDDYLIEKKKKKNEEEKLNSVLAKQQTCKTLGFEIGTPPNGECVLKLMELETKVAESTQTIINNNSGSDEATVNALAETQRQMLIQQQSQSLMNLGSALMNSGKPKINCRQTLTGFSCY